MIHSSQFSTPTVNSKPPSLDSVRVMVEHELTAADQHIIERVGKEVPLIKDITKHIIAAGGKRIRPMLTLLSARLCGYQGEDHIKLAAAVEFIHTATLLHDDVVDESMTRRGNKTANNAFDNKSSVLVGDFLFAQAFQLMVETESLAVLDILSHASATIAAGEVKQLMVEGNVETNYDTYLDVIYHKTAALFAAACESGAAIAQRDDLQQSLRTYGECIGIAFQLVDDALDYASDEAVLGKPIGGDFREGKITLPVIFAYQDANDEEQLFWQRTLGESDQTSEDFAKAKAYMNQHHAIGRTFSEAKLYCEKASVSLKSLPKTPELQALEAIVAFCAARMY